MSIVNRISRLFKADLHAIIDDLETPELVLKQSVREMRSCIEQGEEQLAALKLRQQNIQNYQQSIKTDMMQLHKQLQFCLQEKNDDLARSVLRKKLQKEQLDKNYEQQLQLLNSQISEQSSALDEQKEQLQMVNQKLAVLLTTEADENVSIKARHASVNEDDVELALLYAKRQHNAETTGDSQHENN